MKWIDKWIGTKTDVSRQVGKNLYARRGTYDSSLWTTLVLFVEKKKRKRKRDESRMRKILGSSSPRIRGEKRCNPFDRSNATQWQRITTFPDALRIFARVIVTCLRCYDCCLGMRTFFLFLFFCELVKSKNFFHGYTEKPVEGVSSIQGLWKRFFIENVYTCKRKRRYSNLENGKKEDIDCFVTKK